MYICKKRFNIIPKKTRYCTTVLDAILVWCQIFIFVGLKRYILKMSLAAAVFIFLCSKKFEIVK